jgi:sorting nexin-29
MENIVGQYQCGFRKGKSTTNQIQSMSKVLVNDSGYGICMFHSFIDFKAACDTIRRKELLEALNKFTIP